MRSVLDRSEQEEVRLNQPYQTLPLLVYEGTWTHSRLSLLCITMILHVRRIFFEITMFPNTDRSSTERTAPPSSAHVQLDDVPRTPIQLSVEGEFRQHDGVVTMMMFYRRRASPKHRYDMIEVDYGGGGHRTRLRNDLKDQLVCLEVPLCPRI